MFSDLSIRRQCDVLIVSIAAVLDHQHRCILHGAHQKHISAQVEIINGNDANTLLSCTIILCTMNRMVRKINLSPLYTPTDTINVVPILCSIHNHDSTCSCQRRLVTIFTECTLYYMQCIVFVDSAG